ncbi:trypsin-like serine protease [bacterium]|nr:trypsin-like serine protease [bacterium]
MFARRPPTWSAFVIGALAGALLGAVLLLVRERGQRDELIAEARDRAIEELLAEAGPDTAPAGSPVDEPGTIRPLDERIADERHNAIVRATERVAPAVVTITVTSQVAIRDPRLSFFDFFSPRRRPPRLRVQEQQNYGSGVIVGAEGYVVTNAHVLGQSPTRVLVTLSNGTDYGAEIVEVVNRFDLALLKIEGEDFPVAQLADSDELSIGEWAIAIGSPFGQLLADTQPTVTVGVISALNRDIVRQPQSNTLYLGMIQTDAAINPGNSGGALVNAAGEVVGINTFIFSESGGSIGIGFAVPSNRVRWVLEEVREFGHFRDFNLGLVLYPLTQQALRLLGTSDPVGFLVADVVEESPAWEAGLRPYDILRTINGRTLESRDTVDRLVYEAMVGDRMVFTAERDGRTFSGQIVLEEAQSR